MIISLLGSKIRAQLQVAGTESSTQQHGDAHTCVRAATKLHRDPVSVKATVEVHFSGYLTPPPIDRSRSTAYTPKYCVNVATRCRARLKISHIRFKQTRHCTRPLSPSCSLLLNDNSQNTPWTRLLLCLQPCRAAGATSLCSM